MFRFFRKIRQRLLNSNKVSRYLLYALGEILLVVIGILIALQVDNWNEERKDSKREAALLAEIHRDFLANLELFEQSQAGHQRSLENSEFILGDLMGVEQIAATDSVDAYIISGVLSTSSYDPSSGMVHSLISTGSIELIRSDSLRNLLIAWPDTLRDFKDQEDKANQFTINYIWPYSIENFDIANPENPANDQAWRDIKFRNIVLTRSVMLRALCSGKSRQAVEKALKDIIRMSR